MTTTAEDYTPSGVRIEGPYENDRNAEGSQLFKDIIREVYGVQDVIVAHHLTYVKEDKRDGFTYQVVQEIPAADTLIFDHEVVCKIWGANRYKLVLTRLALEPVATRDKLLAKLYYERTSKCEPCPLNSLSAS